jgi:beta-glucosidase
VTVYNDPNGNGGTDDVVIDQPARYVRMYSTARTTQYGNSLWEFQLFGSPDPQCGPPPVRLEVENGVRSGGLNRDWGMIMDSAGDSVCWSNVDMTGVTKVGVRYSNGEGPDDSVGITFNSASIGSVATPHCGTNGVWDGNCATVSTAVTAQTGSGTLCLVGAGPNWVSALNWVELAQ